MSGQGKGNRPVEITLPDQASDNARAAIPDHAVPEVAEMFREEYGNEPDDRDDCEYIADTIMSEVRERIRQHRYSKAIRAAHQAVPMPEVEF